MAPLDTTTARSTPIGPVTAALAVVGLGTVLSALVGLAYGALIGDLARGFGTAVAVGLAVTAVIGIVVAYEADRRQRPTVDS